MDTALSQHLSRISKLLLAAIGVAFAWVLLSFALGLSAAQAHADDDGLLGGLTSTVQDTTSAVTTAVEDTTAAVAAPVAAVVAPIVEPAAPIVQQVTAPAPVAPVVEVVETVVAPVANAVTESGVVTPVVDSTVAVVETVPVVGEVVSVLGVDTAASSLGSSVDGVLQGTTGAVVDTVGTVTAPVATVVDSTTDEVTAPSLPAIPPLTAVEGVVAGAAGTTASDAAPGLVETLARAAYLTAATAWAAMTSDLPAAQLTGDGAGVTGGVAGIVALVRSLLQADSVFMGPGGAGPGAWVLVALGFVVAHRAWVRRSGPENDVAPPAPVLSTDVSPD